MKRILLPLACLGTLLLAACTSDSQLPTPTGKGTVRAINGIPGAPEIGFLIEEFSLGGVPYKGSSEPQPYDDFSYDFSFQIAEPGATEFTRIATETVQVEADREYMFLLTGALNAPTVTVWTGDVRAFDTADTVFEARFSHASTTLGAVDVYFDPPGTVLGTNPPVATLSLGEIAAPADYAAGPHVLTVTDAGNTGIVHFESTEANLLAQFAHVITIFDGDENDIADYHVRSMTSAGNPFIFAAANSPPQHRFVHGANTLETIDIFDDELLTNRIFAGLDFKGSTGYFDTLAEIRTFYFTPADNIGTTLFNQGIVAPAQGTYNDVYLIGDTDAWSGIRLVPNRQRISNSFKITAYHAALNHQSVDIYLNDRDVPLTDDDTPVIFRAEYGSFTPALSVAAGELDMYITPRDEKTILAGPFPIDAALGEIVELLFIDTVDPATAEIVEITSP